MTTRVISSIYVLIVLISENTIFQLKHNKFLNMSAATCQFIKTHVHFTFANDVTSCDIDTAVATQILFNFVYISAHK